MSEERAQGQPSFEEALERLEEVVRRLEEGELTLEESLRLFREGMELARRCSRMLEEAEGKVRVLLEEDGQVWTEPYRAERGNPAHAG